MKTSLSRNQDVKRDDGKLMLELIPPSTYEALGRCLTYGFKKYGQKDSWQTVEPERYTGALLRHLVAWLDGEELDPESGIHHLEHLLCNAAFLVELCGKKGKHELVS